MPTYDYVCDACEHGWEEFQSMTAKPTKKCPECGKSKARRKIGPGAGIIFRGSGFYQTDYRSESYQAGAKAEAEATKPATNGKADKTDTSTPAQPKAQKPAAKEAKSTD